MKKAELLKLNNELLKVIQSQLERITKLEKDVDYWKTMADLNKIPQQITPYYPTYPDTGRWWDRIVWCGIDGEK